MLRRILTAFENRILPDYFVERTRVAFGLGNVSGPSTRRLFNFDDPDQNAHWTTTADAQLGGLTDVKLEFTEENTAVFSGHIRRMPRRLIEIGKLRKKQSIIEENRERIRLLEQAVAEERGESIDTEDNLDNASVHEGQQFLDENGSGNVSNTLSTPPPPLQAPTHMASSLEAVAIGGSSPHTDLPQSMSGLTRPGTVIRVEPHETSTISHWRAGYAAMRYKFPRQPNLDLFEGFEIKYKGDGRLYTINIRPQSFAGRPEIYQLPLRTIEGKWMLTRVPFTSLARTFRGFITEEQGGFNPSKMVTMSVVLKDDWEGDFRLELDYIEAIADMDHGNFPGQRYVSNRSTRDMMSYPH